MRKYSLLGLVLVGASAVTAAVLPKESPKKAQLAKLQASADGALNVLTCSLTEASVADNCNYTATGGAAGVGSRTSVDLATTSLITTAGGVGQVSTITDVAQKNSSKSPN